jgi:hypothetical protein
MSEFFFLLLLSPVGEKKREREKMFFYCTALPRRGVSHLFDLDSFLPLRQGNSEWNNVTILGCILRDLSHYEGKSSLTVRIRHVTSLFGF